MESIKSNGDKDDWFNAVNIGVSLSTQLFAIGVTILALGGAIFVFYQEHNNISSISRYSLGIGMFTMVVSCFLGGKGIDKARKEGFAGRWNIDSTRSFFNWQAITLILSIVSLGISVVTVRKDDAERPSNYEKKLLLEILDVKKQSEELAKMVDSLSNFNHNIIIELDQVKKRIQEKPAPK